MKKHPVVVGLALVVVALLGILLFTGGPSTTRPPAPRPPPEAGARAGPDRGSADAAHDRGARDLPADVRGGYELTIVSPRLAAVRLAGGPSELAAPRTETARPARTLRGRVVDREGRGVGDVVVLAGERLGMLGGHVTSEGGSTTAPDGSFELAIARGVVFAIALRPEGWSSIARIPAGAPDASVELRVEPVAVLEGKVTYDGSPEAASMRLSLPGHAGEVTFAFDTRPDGTYRFAPAPPGDHDLVAGAAATIGGSASRPILAEVAVRPGQTTTLDLAFVGGVLLVVNPRPPAGVPVTSIEGFLLPGRPAITTRADLDRVTRGLSPDAWSSSLHVGRNALGPFQFHDRTPGPYTACLDLGAGEPPVPRLVCQPVTIAAEPSVQRVEVAAPE